tara:strand:+ start:614 stop:1486 length:873 start_codon:yes stop_codon:yes gene_type:complete
MMDELKLELNTSSPSKLDGLPKIIYRNNDSHVHAKESMEEQFSLWGIKNYQRHSNKYHGDTNPDWKDIVLDNVTRLPWTDVSYSLNLIDSIIEWYDSESSETCIFTDDGLDLSVVNSWMFDWKFLEHQLPYNWDCIQLYTSSRRSIKMHLHPWVNTNKSQRCFMISRTFAKRLKQFHFVDNKYKLAYETPNKSVKFEEYGLLDTFFFDIGVTYTLPVFAFNNTCKLSVEERVGSDAIKYWWKYKSNKFSNFEFFHYNKGDGEWKMEVMFDTQGDRPEVYMDEVEGIMIWI